MLFNAVVINFDAENSCLISLLVVLGGAKEIFYCGKPFYCSTTFRWPNSLAMLSLSQTLYARLTRDLQTEDSTAG